LHSCNGKILSKYIEDRSCILKKNIMALHATKYEELIWKRIKEDHFDPALIMSYGFILHGKTSIQKYISALEKTVLECFQNINSHFFEFQGKLYKRPSDDSNIIIENLEDLSDFDNQYKINHKGDRLYYFSYKKLGDNKLFIGFVFSHLIFDGVSFRIFIQKFENNWNNIGGNDIILKENPSFDFNKSFHDFWKDNLKNTSLYQKIPFSSNADKNQVGFYSIKKTIHGDSLCQIQDLINKNKSSIFQLLLSVMSVTIYKYATEELKEVNLSYTVDTRTEGSFLGCYYNLLPICIPQDENISPKEYLNWIKAERRRVKPYERFPTLELINLVDEKTNRKTSLFNVVVNSSPGLVPVIKPNLNKLEVELLRHPPTEGPFDLGLNFSFNDSKINLSFDSNIQKVNSYVLHDFVKNFIKTLSFFTEKQNQPIKNLDFSDRLKPISVGEVTNYDSSKLSLSTVFLDKIKRANPYDKSILYEDTILDYKELVRLSSVIADKINSEYTTEQLSNGIGIYLSRNEMLPVCILTCLFLEVPFIPIETSLPISRVEYMVNISKTTIVFCDNHTEKQLESVTDNSLNFININKIDFKLDFKNKLTTLIKHNVDTAYIMFTSGSTGKPKGVIISRLNLFNFLESMEKMLPITNKDCFLAITSTSFDISILELLLPLYIGASLEIVSNEIRNSGILLKDKIDKSSVTVIQTTPSVWGLIKDAKWFSNRPIVALVGGEELKEEMAEYLLSQCYNLYNMYGPTETTIWTSISRIYSSSNISIGNPILNTKYYVVNENLMSTSIGAIGELMITGTNIGNGYLNYPNDNFITLAYLNEKGYLTGDYVKNLGNGKIQFLGRKNNFEKINGHRIELEEISATLKQLYPKYEFITIIKEKPNKHLFSYYWSSNRIDEIDEKVVFELLAQWLPSYMIPNRIAFLSEKPLTPSGKLDIKKLSDDSYQNRPSLKEKGSTGTSIDNGDTDFFLNKVKNILFKEFDIEVHDNSLPLSYYGLNSISFNVLSIKIQEEFSVIIPTHEFYKLIDMEGICNALLKRTNRIIPSDLALKKTLEQEKKYKKIAIIGYSGIMPQNMNVEEFWQSLLKGESQISTRSFDGKERKAGFLKDVDSFDAKFFSISPLEAKHMDPRQKLLLQTAWETIENAAYKASDLKSKNVGCYIATTGNDFNNVLIKKNNKQIPFSLSGYSLSILSNRISNYFDWRGPSITLDAACSGSLCAFVRACNDLANDVCDLVFVGGVNLILDDQVNEALEIGNFLSPNSRCASFDKNADGYVRGEGVLGVLIKRYEDAIKDGDTIHAVVESYVENHGGRSTSLTAPNQIAQEDLYFKAYSKELAKEVSYIETHGTGTKLGDPIEIDALKNAWDFLLDKESNKKTIWLGALKSNIGHLEAAAGLASLMKSIYIIKKRLIPGNLNFEELNPLIHIKESPFKIVKETIPLDEDIVKIGISSFGFGGSNAHIVISEERKQHKLFENEFKEPYLFLLSAKDKLSLQDTIKNYIQLLSEEEFQKDNNIKDLSYTLITSREQFGYRIAWTANSIKSCIQQLSEVKHFHYVERAFLNKKTITMNSDTQDLEIIKSAFLEGSNIYWDLENDTVSYKKLNLPTYHFTTKTFTI
jgi:amino acid adenylation domain-containing protein